MCCDRLGEGWSCFHWDGGSQDRGNCLDEVHVMLPDGTRLLDFVTALGNVAGLKVVEVEDDRPFEGQGLPDYLVCNPLRAAHSFLIEVSEPMILRVSETCTRVIDNRPGHKTFYWMVKLERVR